MSDSKPETSAEVITSPPKQDAAGEANATEKPKGRRGSAGRTKVSQIMKAVQEGEALLKEMGHTEDGPEVEGRRRTRSSARGGPPIITPPPVKRERRSGSGAASNSSEKKKATPTPPAAKGRGRGRRKKSDIESEDVATEENNGDIEMHDVEETDTPEAKPKTEDAVDSKDKAKAKEESKDKPKEVTPAPVEPKPSQEKFNKEVKSNDVSKPAEPKVEAKPETPKKPEEKIPTPVKEPPPPPVVEKPQEPSPVKISPPVVIEAKKEEKKEVPAVVPSAAVTNASSTPEKKNPSSLDTDKEVKGQSPVTAAPVNNGNSTSVSNAVVSPPKTD